jgi:hypothetical protein
MPRPLPIPLPKLPDKETPQIPPEVAKLFKARPGFANYYFNELHRDRIWSAVRAKGDFGPVAGTWILEGELAAGGKVGVKLADNESSGEFPQGAVQLDAAKDLDEQLGPPGSGGLLAALHLWRQMLVSGPQKFGEVDYYGTAPYAGVEDQADVLSCVRNVAQTNFVFDRKAGQLALVEMFGDPGQDPCEVRFLEYRDVGGRQFPHKMEVRHGETIFAVISWTKVELSPLPGQEPPK